MCEELCDPFQDQVACARYRAERDALAQAVQVVCERMEAHCLGVEGMDESPVASWARDLRAALGSLHCFQNDSFADTDKKIDRDALLAMADEMEEFGNLPVRHPGVCVLHNEDFSRELGYARRIRKALGMVPDGK